MKPTLVLLALAAAPVAEAQGSAKVLKDKEAVTFEEVERGLYFGVTAGPWFLINPPALEGGKRPFSPGQMAQVEVGFDFGDRFSLGAFVMGSANRAGSDYTGKSKGGVASGDFSAIAPGAVVRVNALGFYDSQQVRRTWIYIRGGAGLALLPDLNVLIFGGPGVEYYTRLRHFSIGIELTGSFLAPDATIGFAISPNLRYAF